MLENVRFFAKTAKYGSRSSSPQDYFHLPSVRFDELFLEEFDTRSADIRSQCPSYTCLAIGLRLTCQLDLQSYRGNSRVDEDKVLLICRSTQDKSPWRLRSGVKAS